MEELEKKRRFYSITYFATMCLHILYTVIFAGEKAWWLVGINFVELFIYMYLGFAAKNAHRFVELYLTCAAAILIFILTHLYFLGAMFGYQYMFFGILPVVFYLSYTGQKSTSYSIKVCIFIAVVFEASMIFCTRFQPVYIITEQHSILLKMINSVVAFSLELVYMVLFTSRVVTDTGSLKTQNSSLEISANVDTLTGLRNRRSVDDFLKIFHDRARGEGRDYTILMCDIDNFKRVNDTYGHDCGDEVLKNISQILSSEVRPDDVVFRWGGEEILLIIDGGSFSAEKIAERCRKSVEKSEVVYKDTVVKVTITIGGASYYQGATSSNLIERADKNLYIGKNSGKNQVVI